MIPDDVVYFDELEQSPEERKRTQQQRKQKFKRTDQYHLPDMEHDFNEFRASNDVRILTAEELQEYARQFDGMEDTNLQDLSNIDFSSAFFAALPDADRYRILSQARMRSRLRMGYSKDQLDAMFPDRMAFSKFQIERLMRRNELSQRLMNIQGREKDLFVGRVAGEKGKEYILVRDEEAGGWSMSFVGNKGELEGAQSNPIDVEIIGQETEGKALDSEEDEEFEDVPVEGLNRLPKAPVRRLPGELAHLLQDQTVHLRKAVYQARLDWSGGRGGAINGGEAKGDALFLGEDILLGAEPEGFQDEDDLHYAISLSLGDNGIHKIDNEENDLERAIALSLLGRPPRAKGKGKDRELVDDTSTGDIRGNANNDDDDGDDDGDDPEFQLAVSESLRTHRARPDSPSRRGEGSGAPSSKALPGLPRALDLSKSSSFLVGKTRSEGAKPPPRPPISGKPSGGNQGAKEGGGESPVPLPPWFGQSDIVAELDRAKEQTAKVLQECHGRRNIQRQSEVVEIVSVDDGDDDSDGNGDLEFVDVGMNANTTKEVGKRVVIDDLAERSRAIPLPVGSKFELKEKEVTIEPPVGSDEEIEWSESDDGRPVSPGSKDRINLTTVPSSASESNPLLVAVAPGPPPPTSPRPSELELDDFDLSFEQESTPPPEELTPEAIDEEELLRQMEREVEEHARFAVEVSRENDGVQSVPDYERELKSLRQQQKRDLRDADEVTQVMIQECQQLLKLFGLPYITAPMEAEAQCAELAKLGLVDGIVTDDSDVFLFGGMRVYRHMFNDRHTVQCYLASDLEKELSMDQKRLIAAALLLGSDYTEGIPSIGPVSAVEILAEFANEGLAGFRAWWLRVQQGIDAPDESSSRFRKRFKRLNVAKVFLPPSFPDPRVEDAYLRPEVDSDPSQFEWGVPDLDGLRMFLVGTLGWSKERTDEILLPVVKDMNRKLAEGSQTNITSFFDGSVGAGAFAPRAKTMGGSKRLEQAMAMLKSHAGGPEEVAEEAPRKVPMSMSERFARQQQEQDAAQVEKVVPKKRKGKHAPKKRKAPPGGQGFDDGSGEDELPKTGGGSAKGKTSAKRGRKAK